MIITLFINFVVVVLNVLFSVLPAVTTLPTIASVDMDAVFVSISSTFHGVLLAIPPLGIVFTCLLWFYSIKLALLTWRFVQWIINLIRGSGT